LGDSKGFGITKGQSVRVELRALGNVEPMRRENRVRMSCEASCVKAGLLAHLMPVVPGAPIKLYGTRVVVAGFSC
jgi:hypothetical protein